MSGRPRNPTLRARLVGWFTVLTVCALVIYAVFVYVAVRRVLWREFDLRLHHDVETIEGLLQPHWTADGPRTPPGVTPLDDDDPRWFEVWSRDGRRLFQSPVAAAAPMDHLPPPGVDASWSLQIPAGGHVRVKDEQGHIARVPIVMRLAQSEDDLRRELSEILWIMGIGLPLCTATALWGGHRLARRAFAPMERLADWAGAMTADRLGERIPVDQPDDEVGRLTRGFNATMARLDASFEQARRFNADASHELRTPLTAIKAVGQVALREPHDEAGYREVIGSMIEEVDRLTQLLDTMLLLSRTDNGQVPLARRDVDLGQLASDVAAECRVLAEEKGQQLLVETAHTRASVDPAVVRLALANLLHNAIRYSPEGSEITLRSSDEHGRIVVEVEDNGPGIAPHHHARLFDRFYRVDGGRSRLAGGAGLGLSIARWAVESHGGVIGVESAPGQGSIFRMSFPKDAGSAV